MAYAPGDILYAADLVDLASAWPTWSPTTSGLTIGNGVITARNRLVGKTCDYRFKFKFGSTSAVTATVRFSLPYTPHASLTTVQEDSLGEAFLVDAGTGQRYGSVRWAGAAEVIGYSTTGVAVLLSSTVPHTWAVNDVIACWGRYEIA